MENGAWGVFICSLAASSAYSSHAIFIIASSDRSLRPSSRCGNDNLDLCDLSVMLESECGDGGGMEHVFHLPRLPPLCGADVLRDFASFLPAVLPLFSASSRLGERGRDGMLI